MWYFSWILGIGFAACLGVINAMWYEFQAGGYEVQSEQQENASLPEDVDQS